MSDLLYIEERRAGLAAHSRDILDRLDRDNRGNPDWGKSQQQLDRERFELEGPFETAPQASTEEEE